MMRTGLQILGTVACVQIIGFIVYCLRNNEKIDDKEPEILMEKIVERQILNENENEIESLIELKKSEKELYDSLTDKHNELTQLIKNLDSIDENLIVIRDKLERLSNSCN